MIPLFKRKAATVSIQIGVILLLITFYILTACNSNQSTGVLLEDIDFSNGKYALYIKHKELGEFMVLDEEALKENRHKLKVEGSILNYFPGEGDRSFGVMLFKDNVLVSHKLGGLFTYFETGNLTDDAIPVKSHSINGVKNRIQKKRDSLLKRNNTLITYQSTFVPDNRTFCFRVYYPSIAVPITRKKDSSGYERITTVNGIEYNTWIMESEFLFEKKWGEKIETCIRDKADLVTDFEVSITKSSMSEVYLFDKEGNDLRMPNKKMLHVKDYMYYNFSAYVMADKSSAEKLLNLDFSDCINEEERNRSQVIAKVKELVKQSTQPNLDIDEGEVGLEGYKDKLHKYETLYEQEYTLTWLEAKKL